MNSPLDSSPVYLPPMKRLRQMGPRIAVAFWSLTALVAGLILYFRA